MKIHCANVSRHLLEFCFNPSSSYALHILNTFYAWHIGRPSLFTQQRFAQDRERHIITRKVTSPLNRDDICTKPI